MIVSPRTSTATIRKMGRRGNLRKHYYDGTRSDQAAHSGGQIPAHTDGPKRRGQLTNELRLGFLSAVEREESGALPGAAEVVVNEHFLGGEDPGTDTRALTMRVGNDIT